MVTTQSLAYLFLSQPIIITNILYDRFYMGVFSSVCFGFNLSGVCLHNRAPLLDPVNNYWKSSSGGSDQEIERRERKGWKVMIHDLSGSAVAAAFMTTPFVPSTGCDRVARSNPGAWLIVLPDACGHESWQPWGKLEA